MKGRRRQELLDAVRGKETSSSYSGKYLKDHLVEIANFFVGDSNLEECNKKELRRLIRSHAETGDPSETNPFRYMELRRLTETAEEQARLDAETVCDCLVEARETGATRLSVNGQVYAVDSFTESHNCDSEGYEGYIYAQTEDRFRILGFFEWNDEECYYSSGAVVEKRDGRPPYYKWSKKEYIASIEILDE